MWSTRASTWSTRCCWPNAAASTLIERKKHQHEDIRLRDHADRCAPPRTSGAGPCAGPCCSGEPHIVGINEQWVDFPATGTIVLTSHVDQPGIIGRVGTMLGEADVNISFMHVGRRAPRTEAIMALGTDEVPAASILQKLDDLDEILWMYSVTL